MTRAAHPRGRARAATAPPYHGRDGAGPSGAAPSRA